MNMKSILFVLGGLVGVHGCTSKCGDKEVQLFLLADMSMKLCNNDSMVQYMDGVLDFVVEAESVCPGNLTLGYGVFGDKSDLNPLFCHINIIDVGSNSKYLVDHRAQFDFNDGVGLSSKSHIGEIYHRVIYQDHYHEDALKIIIVLTNDEFGMNDGTGNASIYDPGACNPGGCDCPGPYFSTSDLTPELISHDIKLAFIVTPEVADFYRNQVTENGWNAVVEEGIQLPPSQQLWNIVQGLNGC